MTEHVKIEVYSTAVCPSCVRAKALLRQKGVSFVEYSVDSEPERFVEMLERTAGRRTVPAIFIANALIGGFDDLQKLDATGKLDALLGL